MSTASKSILIGYYHESCALDHLTEEDIKKVVLLYDLLMVNIKAHVQIT